MENLENFSETKVQVTLGETEYTVEFGIFARRRIEEQHPGFSLYNHSLPDFEVVPFLVKNGIEPEDRKWKSEDEFYKLFDACKDVDNLQKIPLAFFNAMGFTNQLFAPVYIRANSSITEMKLELERAQTK